MSDPIYVWNHTGVNAYDVGLSNQIPAWGSVVKPNRDYFMNTGAKPGYTKFTYPHPLRAVVEGAGRDPQVDPQLHPPPACQPQRTCGSLIGVCERAATRS